MDLYRETYKILNQIPKGKISTYKEIAKALGDENAVRVVANIIKTFPISYRVIRSDGIVEIEKIELLMKEGIEIKNGKVNVGKYIFKDFVTYYPLKRLRKEQVGLRKKICLKDEFGKVRTIAGMDVAYDKEKAYGAYVEMDMEGNMLKGKIVEKEITFPYIPSYLAYRELPVLNNLIKKEKPSVVMIDGNGVLHPYKFGIASHFGILNDIPSIGVAKKLLCGEVKNGYIYLKGEKVGIIYKKNTKPIYISPGHKISMESAFMLTKKMCIYRLPEPLRKAHILANEAKLRRYP